jgi:hypothetical protein
MVNYQYFRSKNALFFSDATTQPVIKNERTVNCCIAPLNAALPQNYTGDCCCPKRC